MQDNTPRKRQAAYTGRFADPTGGAPSRDAVRQRPRAGRASEGQPQRRPSGFSAPEPRRRGAETLPKPAESTKPKEKKPGLLARLRSKRKDAPPKEIQNKRAPAKRRAWLKWLLIALAAIALIYAVLALIFGGRGKTHHQLPRIERGGGDSAYAPEQSAAPTGETGAEDAQYLTATPDPLAGFGDGSQGDVDWSQYLVTPEAGVNLSEAAAAAGANYDAGATGGEGT